jgi:hypothetical protein
MSLTGYTAYTYDRGFRNQEFHHVVLSVSGTVHTLYLDGVQVQQNSSAGNIFASYQTITNTVIGAQTTLAQAFQGTIGDVRVYNYAIPPTLVTSLYRDRELIVYYPFDTSVNALTPNYATLVYDASLIGQPLITASAGANVGSGALSLTNSATTAATQYIIGAPGIAGQVGWRPDVTHGITISCWINVAGVAGRVQRIFDIPISVGTKGLAIDISGTNMLYSVWNTNIAPFTPNLVSGMTLWLDAASASNFTFSSGTTISTWIDKSGRGNNVTRGGTSTGNATHATNTLNTLGTVSFGSNVWYLSSFGAATYPSDVYVVVKLNSISTMDVFGIGTINGFFNGLQIGEYSNTVSLGQARWDIGSNGFLRTPNTMSGTNETSTNFLIMQYSVANNSFYINRNGLQISFTNSYTFSPPGDLAFIVGCRSYNANNFLNGSIAEILCYNTQLSTYDRQQVEGYLAAKWGLQSSLPGNHPYKNAAPTIVT